MSRRRRTGIRENRILVAISILGLDENGRKRTQNEVSIQLGYPKSTVSECIRDLIRGGFIIETGKSSKDKIYSRGPKFAMLESQISDEIREKLRNLKSVRINSPPVTSPEHGAPSDGCSRDVDLAWEVHLPGEMLMFGVDQEGSIERVGVRVSDPVTGKECTLMQTIFGDVQPYEISGGVNWSGSFVLPGRGENNRFRMRYHKTTSGMKLFYVKPEFEIIVSSDVSKSVDALRRAFIGACTPLLIWLEKYAGWIFVKDSRGMYDLKTKISATQVHRAMRGEVNDLITELTDGAFVGNGTVWADKSPGYVEMETNAVDYVEAVVDMVDTKRKANIVFTELPSVKEDLARLSADVEELTSITRKLYEISLNIVRTETNSLRVLSRSQTTLDNLPSIEQSVDDTGSKFPMEGYQ